MQKNRTVGAGHARPHAAVPHARPNVPAGCARRLDRRNATRRNSLDLAGRLHFADPSGPTNRGFTWELRQRRRKLRNGGWPYLIAAKIRL